MSPVTKWPLSQNSQRSDQTRFDLTWQLQFPLDVVNQDLISKNGLLWMGVCHRNCVKLIKLVM